MKKTGIFYGSSTGVTSDIAEIIGGKLGVDSSDIHDVGDARADAVAPYELLILGSSTWGVGDLQDDWEDFLPKLKKMDLSGKTVALFGSGDASSYSDSFCDAVGTIYSELQGTGCRFCGEFSKDGYSFDESTAEKEGKLVGLLIDEVNEPNLTDDRIDRWVEILKESCA